MFEDFYRKIQSAFKFHKTFIMQFNFILLIRPLHCLVVKIHSFYSFKKVYFNFYSSKVLRLLKKSVHVSTILVVWNTIHWRGENRVRQLCIFLGQEEYNRQSRRNRGAGGQSITQILADIETKDSLSKDHWFLLAPRPSFILYSSFVELCSSFYTHI